MAVIYDKCSSRGVERVCHAIPPVNKEENALARVCFHVNDSVKIHSLRCINPMAFLRRLKPRHLTRSKTQNPRLIREKLRLVLNQNCLSN